MNIRKPSLCPVLVCVGMRKTFLYRVFASEASKYAFTYLSHSA